MGRFGAVSPMAKHNVRLGQALAGGAQPRRINFSNLPPKDKSRESKCSFGFYGPSGEIRTPGILIPNRGIIFFLILFSPFRGFCSERSCFPELFAPLFPSVRILSMVKNVVKSKHSPKGSTFRGAFSSSRVP